MLIKYVGRVYDVASYEAIEVVEPTVEAISESAVEVRRRANHASDYRGPRVNVSEARVRVASDPRDAKCGRLEVYVTFECRQPEEE